MSIVVIFNPTAGRRRAQRLQRVVDVLLNGGVRVAVTETQYRGHATVLAHEAAGRGVSLVVAAGGDGTISEVAKGLMGQQSTLGIIPLGTVNVLARELSLPFAPHAIAAAFMHRRTRIFWPGLAQCNGQELMFVQMLGVGFDAQVVHRTSLPMKRLLGRAAYVLQGFREVVRYSFPRIRLCLDGQDTEASSVIVSKGRFYAGHYMLAPQANNAEPGFHVALLQQGGPINALICSAALSLDVIARVPGLRLVRAQKIQVLAESIPVQTDGDPVGYSPLNICDAPAPLQVVVD